MTELSKIYRVPQPRFLFLSTRTPKFLGGDMFSVELIPLAEAVKMATRHAGVEVTQRDFLRAASQGKICLMAILRRTVKLKRLLDNSEEIHKVNQHLALPLSACHDLARTSLAIWNYVESVEETGLGNTHRYKVSHCLADDEKDIETTPADCLVYSMHVHALADTFIQKKPQATPAPQAETPNPAPVADSASDAPAWTVNAPKRYSGYTAPLYRLLAAAQSEGRLRPTARDVVEAWRINQPQEVAQVLPDGFNYYDATGNIKAANLEAIRKAIDRMTSGR